MTAARFLILSLLAWGGYVLLLQVPPRVFPPPPNQPNVASMLGYNIDLAYMLVLGWSVAVASIAAVVLRRPVVAQPAAATPAVDAPPGPLRRWLERGIVAAGALVLYWPGSLARFGPHVEDLYFLNVLWRMECGAVPYRDFEFLYGPLMLAPAAGALDLAGFSMTGYFAVYAVGQMVFYAALMAVLQHYLPRALARYAAFLLLLPFVIDLIYGLNWIAWRHFGAALALLLVAARPRSIWVVAGAGAILGLQGAYSYEYGIAGLLATLAALGTGLLQPGRIRVLALMALLSGAAVGVWAAAVVVLTGADFGAYLETTLLAAKTASSQGLGRFAFGWTLQSLALFALLAMAVVLAAGGVARVRTMPAAEGDRQIIGALVFALITLKIAFQRVDYLHMAVPFVPLALVLVLNAPRRLLAAPAVARQALMAALVLAAVGQIAGHLPQGRWFMLGSARGLLHEITGRPVVGPIDARAASIHSERSHATETVVQLAARLAAPDLAGRPVLFYGGLWGLAPETAACPLGYAFYDLLYTDSRAPLAQTLSATPDALVVIKAETFDALAADAEPETVRRLGPYHALAQRLASPHFAQSHLENRIEFAMWRQAVGDYLVAEFRTLDRVGDMLLLERKTYD